LNALTEEVIIWRLGLEKKIGGSVIGIWIGMLRWNGL
jgi:hypothetical protein